MPAIRVPSSYPGTSCDDGWDELRYKHADAEGFPARSYDPKAKPCAPFDLAGNLEQLLASMNRVKAGAK